MHVSTYENVDVAVEPLHRVGIEPCREGRALEIGMLYSGGQDAVVNETNETPLGGAACPLSRASRARAWSAARPRAAGSTAGRSDSDTPCAERTCAMLCR